MKNFKTFHTLKFILNRSFQYFLGDLNNYKKRIKVIIFWFSFQLSLFMLSKNKFSKIKRHNSKMSAQKIDIFRQKQLPYYLTLTVTPRNVPTWTLSSFRLFDLFSRLKALWLLWENCSSPKISKEFFSSVIKITESLS